MAKKDFSNILLYTLIFFIIFFLSAILFSQIVLKGETVSVPDVTGKTLSEARTALEKKDLTLVQKSSESSDDIERGRIVRQNPVPGSKIRVTNIVNVSISSGSRKVAVPALEGRNLETAVSLLKEAGLFKGVMTHIHTPQFAAGKIISQKPPVSEAVERNTAVGLLVSQGELEERFVMPDLIGKRVDRVMASLKNMDFKIGDIRYVYYPGLEKDIIIKQSPPNGYKIQKRNFITLEVSR